MKTHHIVTLLLIVVLIAIGYLITAWVQSIPAGEEEPSPEGAIESALPEAPAEAGVLAPLAPEVPASEGEAVEVEAPEAAPDGGSVPPEQGETPAEVEPPVAPEPAAAPEEATSPQAEADGEAPLLLVAERTTTAERTVITVKLRAVGQSFDLSGWRLSDALGQVGQPDHVYYFGAPQPLPAGETLTLYSDCGRDQDGVLYWCLSHPLAIWDVARDQMFLHDDRGRLAYTCIPTDRAADRVRYRCR